MPVIIQFALFVQAKGLLWQDYEQIALLNLWSVINVMGSGILIYTGAGQRLGNTGYSQISAHA